MLVNSTAEIGSTRGIPIHHRIWDAQDNKDWQTVADIFDNVLAQRSANPRKYKRQVDSFVTHTARFDFEQLDSPSRRRIKSGYEEALRTPGSFRGVYRPFVLGIYETVAPENELDPNLHQEFLAARSQMSFNDRTFLAAQTHHKDMDLVFGDIQKTPQEIANSIDELQPGDEFVLSIGRMSKDDLQALCYVTGIRDLEVEIMYNPRFKRFFFDVGNYARVPVGRKLVKSGINYGSSAFLHTHCVDYLAPSEGDTDKAEELSTKHCFLGACVPSELGVVSPLVWRFLEFTGGHTSSKRFSTDEMAQKLNEIAANSIKS